MQPALVQIGNERRQAIVIERQERAIRFEEARQAVRGVMVPESHLHRHEWDPCLDQATRPHECFPVPGYRTRGMRVHEAIPSGAVTIERLRFFIAQVERLARLAAGQHIQSLFREGIHRVHFPVRVHFAAEIVQAREQLLAVLQPREVHLPAQLQAPQPVVVWHESAMLRPDPERLLGFGDFLVVAL